MNICLMMTTCTGEKYFYMAIVLMRNRISFVWHFLERENVVRTNRFLCITKRFGICFFKCREDLKNALAEI